jgi:CheY-like chemotaxis protein
MPAKILDADDEPPLVDVVATVLEGEGRRVLCAHNGAAALDLIERERPDLATPVVLMSAVTPTTPPPPPTVFLPKLFDIDQLAALVADLLPTT